MSDIAIRVEGLKKRYRLGTNRKKKYSTLRDSLTPSRLFSRQERAKDTAFWALDDVSFEVKRGEVIGVIGHNGAGKSTLLKVLSRITEPTDGYVDIFGRVGSLLEVGTGFHPELSGRENVFLNGAILGMTKTEIERQFDEIVAFAEVEKFIDTPVKHYSSGMGLRLGFAVAAHLNPEILIVDEVLAVGDAAFQQKCMGKMNDVSQEGRTVLFVSHNMAAVSGLCKRGLMLESGKVLADGPVVEVLAQYVKRSQELVELPLNERTDRQGNGALRMTSVALEDSNGCPLTAVQSGQDVVFVIGYEATDVSAIQRVGVSLRVMDSKDQVVFTCMNEMSGNPFADVPARGQFRCRVPRLPLAAGNYSLQVACGMPSQLVDRVRHAAQITVVEGDYFHTGILPTVEPGVVFVPHNWDLISASR